MRFALAAVFACAAAAAAADLALPATLCCTADFERSLTVATGAEPSSAVTLQVEPEGLVRSALRTPDAQHLEIRMQALHDGRGRLVLRGGDGARLAACDLQVMAITTDCERSIGTQANLPDGSAIFVGQIILRPHVPGLDIRFACLSQQVTVLDGLAERMIASETFTPMPDGSSQTTFRMLRAPKAKWVPFTYIIYQDGEQISAP